MGQAGSVRRKTIDRNYLLTISDVGMKPIQDSIVEPKRVMRRERRIEWSIVSKAADRSKRVKSDTVLESRAVSK